MGGNGWKKTRPLFFCRGAGRIHPLLSPSLLLPTTLPCQNINCNLYRKTQISPSFEQSNKGDIYYTLKTESEEHAHVFG
ncbi:hypothetical protein SAMN04487909_1142 [Aneurinibacillus migulanus]|uniref:Uncharacterized protein n=1 Tax=Aneurinibacillus migulanus TaxID=47500 RepID=A0A1G8RZB4_ANEMI|nr:hypothetical protein SAMN04487909_1142 [Aneurinibacillus migulanus]